MPSLNQLIRQFGEKDITQENQIIVAALECVRYLAKLLRTQQASKGVWCRIGISQSANYLESHEVKIELGKPRTRNRQVYTAVVEIVQNGEFICHHIYLNQYGENNINLLFSVSASDLTHFVPWFCLIDRGINFNPRHPDYWNPNSEDDQRGLLSALASHNLAPWYK